MQATSGDSKQNRTAVFWLSLSVSSKNERSLTGSRTEGNFIASRTWIRAVSSPDDLVPLSAYAY